MEVANRRPPIDTDSEVFRNALAQVKEELHSQDNLNSLADLKAKYLSKKANVDTRLRTAIKSQLDGVKTGLQQLDTAVKEMHQIRENMAEVNNAYKRLNTMNVMLPNLVDTAAEHSQLLAAKENFAYIVQVPEKVATIARFIEEGKLIYAHSYLAGLENCRDDLLVELFRQSKSSPDYDHNVQVIRHFFGEIEKLFEKLRLKIMEESLPRFLELANTDPAELTNIARIIWREEAKNKLCREVKAKEGIDNPDRLSDKRQWRDECLEQFRRILAQRISRYFSNLLEFLMIGEFYGKTDFFGIEVHKIKLQVVQDIKTIKFHVVKCFPPNFSTDFPNFYEFFIHVIHGVMKEKVGRVCDAVCDPKSNEQERFAQKTLILQMLYFVKFQYLGDDFMGVPELEIDLSKISEIQSQSVINNMQDQFEFITKEALKMYSENSLEREVRSWKNPELDTNGYYVLPKIVSGFRYTQLHIDLFQAINSSFESVAFDKKIPSSITYNVGKSAIQCYSSFADNYENALRKFYEDLKNRKEFDDGNMTVYFLAVMVANMNCCHTVAESNLEKLGKKFLNSGDWTEEQKLDIEKSVRSAKQRFHSIANAVASDLVFGHFCYYTKEKYLDNLMTRETWLVDENESLYESIMITITDYLEQDLNTLQSRYVEVFINKCQREIAVCYLKKLIVKRTFGGALSATGVEDRTKIAYKMKSEADKLHKYFIDKLETLKGTTISHSEGPLQAVISAAEVYICGKDMMMITLGVLVKKHPDITQVQLERLLGFHEDFRGDAGRTCARESMSAAPALKQGQPISPTIFSHPDLKAS